MPGLVVTDDGALPRNTVRATRRAAFTEPNRGSLASKFRRLGPVAVNVPLDHRVPARAEIVGQFVARTAVVKRQTAGQDHQVLVVVLPQPVDDLGHELQHAARALEAVDRRPVLVEPVEHLGWIG